jgi:putative aldouronate transport system permease protein
MEQLQSSIASDPTIAALLTRVDGSGTVTAQSLELAAMVLAAIPMIIMYPFAQKFFTKGMLLGSVKE